MAEKNGAKENAKTKETTKTAGKKIATGSTKKVVQKRSYSAASKTTTKKATAGKTTTTKKTTKASSKTSTTPKTASKKTTTSKKATTTKSVKPAVAEMPKEELEKQPITAVKEEKAKTTTKKAATKTAGKTATKTTKKTTTKASTKSGVKTTSAKTTAKKAVEKEEADKKAEEVISKVDNKEEKTKKEATKKVEDKKATTKKEESKKKTDTKLQARSSSEIEEAVEKEIKGRKKLPEVEFNKINTRIFQNICLAVVTMLYLHFVVLGFVNIENSVFVTDIKVFSIALLIVAIAIFEYAYKKDSGRHAIHGIEVLMLALTTMAFIYTNLIWADRFIYVVALVTYLFAIYYVAKSIIIYNKMKKEYFVNEMKEIIKK